ncbi:prepilin-type N-terminal cleavage/methylation domain-containing protein [Motiliproteus sp. SC1-56]|uniref:type IV pilus modification PilV family protein n=1 Tax=Motiliproteus sp. SC1-56 TaxID=2799565 RepID=UPI001A901FDA|nr:prepilin-type N-terminal cleavage/methylation domain-containing protein [Motiliproteus sp. SC1-56]
MSRRSLRLNRAARGFTLIELLVAFVILTLSMSVVYAIFSNGLRSLALSQDFSRAALLGESHLATVGVVEPIEEAEREGRFDDKYGWQLQVLPVSKPSSPVTRIGEAPPLVLYRLALTVSWQRAGKPRALQLDTLRVAQADGEWVRR